MLAEKQTRITTGGITLKGRISQTPIGYEHNLEGLGIKIIPYLLPKFESGTLKCEVERHYKKWLSAQSLIGRSYVVLWKGKHEQVTTVQPEYHRHHPVGMLLWPDEAVIKEYNLKYDSFLEKTPVDRTTKGKAIDRLHKILWGERKDLKDGLLYQLNGKDWTAIIEDNKNDVVFFEKWLTKSNATHIMDSNLNRLYKELSK